MQKTLGRLSNARLAGFVSLEIPMAAFLTPLIVYIPAFYAGEMGLGLSAVGLIFGLTKLWDIVTDPIAGVLTDRFGPSVGRRRFWLLVSLPIMLLGIYQVFLPPEGVTVFYFAFWMTFVYVGWTLLTISHISWGVELSSEYHERARIAAFRQAASLIGALLIVFIPVISDQFGSGAETSRIAGMGIFVMTALPILAVIVVLAVPSTKVETVRQEYGFKDIFTILKHNQSLRALLLCNMGVLLAVAGSSSALLFFVEDVLRLDEWASFAIIPSIFAGLLFLPLLKSLTRKVGKRQTFRWVLIYEMITLPLLLFVPPENLGLAILVLALKGASSGATIFLPLAMIADLTDVEIGSMGDRTGIYVALLQSTSKVSAAFAVALMFLVLPLTGFDPSPDVVNDEASLNGLRYMMVGLPFCCYAIGLFALRSYKLDKAAYQLA